MKEQSRSMDIRISGEPNVPRDKGVYGKNTLMGWATMTDFDTDYLVAKSLFKQGYQIRFQEQPISIPGQQSFFAIRALNERAQSAYATVVNSPEISRLSKKGDPKKFEEAVSNITASLSKSKSIQKRAA